MKLFYDDGDVETLRLETFQDESMRGPDDVVWRFLDKEVVDEAVIGNAQIAEEVPAEMA